MGLGADRGALRSVRQFAERKGIVHRLCFGVSQGRRIRSSGSCRDSLSMKLSSIQLARAIACLLVCVYHLFGLSRDYAQGVFYDPSVFGFTGGVDVFFVISGVVMVVTTDRKYGRRNSATRFAIHRLTRIYPPYWVLAATLTVFWLLNLAVINAKHGGVDLFTSFTLIPSKLLPIVPVAWTLSFELMFYGVFWAMLAFVPKRRLPAALISWTLFILVGSGLVALLRFQLLVLTFVTSPFVLEFVAGCFIGFAYLSGRMIAPGRFLIFGVVSFGVVLVGLHVWSVPEVVNVPVRVAMFIVPSVSLVYGLLGLEAAQRLGSVPKLLMAVGDSSYSLYLVHILVIHAAYRYAYKYVGGEFAILFLAGTFVFAVLAGFSYYRAVERPVSAMARRALERVAGISSPAAKGA